MNALLQSQIRRGKSDDMPAVLRLLRGAGLPTADLEGIPGLRVWVAETKESLVGVIAMERFGAQALLRSLAVASPYQKCGLGRQLVARLEHDALASGIRQLALLTETAEQFFRSLGYGVIDRRSVSEELQQCAEFRSLCPASAVCMSKALNTQEDAPT